MATLGEIDAAVRAARETGNADLVVLVLHRRLPRPARDAPTCAASRCSRDAFGVPVGLSDHTLGIGASVAAVALGATVIEKHVTLSRDGRRRRLRLLPRARRVRRAGRREPRSPGRRMGEPRIGPKKIEAEGLRFRRSLFVSRDVKAGERVSADNVRSVRPADGLPPDLFRDIEGRVFRVMRKGTPMSLDLL